jgi:hypothetical protein
MQMTSGRPARACAPHGTAWHWHWHLALGMHAIGIGIGTGIGMVSEPTLTKESMPEPHRMLNAALDSKGEGTQRYRHMQHDIVPRGAGTTVPRLTG